MRTVDRQTVVRPKSYVAQLVPSSGAVSANQAVAHEDSDRVSRVSCDDGGRVMMPHPVRNRDVRGRSDVESVGVAGMSLVFGDRSVDQVANSELGRVS
jgi:hypothetical protein